MLWIIPAWTASLIATFLLGYHIHKVMKMIEQLERMVQSKTDKVPRVREPESTFIDPLDPIQEANYEHNKMMERLNGKSNDN